MGQEKTCKLRLGKKLTEGKALLESEELIFRGKDLRLKIPFRQMSAIEAKDGWLRLNFSEGAAAFELGGHAAKWAEKIRNPKSLIDKLGIKPEHRVSVLGVRDEAFRRELQSRTGNASDFKVASDSDMIFLAADTTDDLSRMRALQASLKSNGAIWVVYPKGQKHITEAGVLAAGKQAGFVDVKVASFSPTHTALKFVIPVDRR
ncbi:MAG: hypothetical protein JWO48_879 [Bryobacterales bacterium]|nr:hypothetical protein [Bryobacterales bacterium]